MRGKVVVITGGTSGIGQVAAEQLAGMGARIVLVARSQTRGAASLARLRQAGPDIEHGVRYADLSSIADTRRLAAEIAAAEPRIDVLINNAGALFNTRQLSPDRLEMTFAVNHMAYFVLTEGLRERLIASGPARVVSTASAAHGAPGWISTTCNRARAIAALASMAAPSWPTSCSPANSPSGWRGPG